MNEQHRQPAETGLIYFNHIPKTAGTSFRNSLERIYPPAYHNTYWFADEYVSDARSRIDSYQLLSGHLAMIPPAMSQRKHDILTFLRHPDMRAFSHYLHVKTDAESPWRRMVQEMSYEDFLFSPIAEAELLSFQARFLGMTSPSDYFAVKDRPLDRGFLTNRYRATSLLDAAKRTLKNAWFVGVTEQYASSVDRLSHMFGVPLDGGGRLNVARIKSECPALSPAGQSRLAWLNEFDHELYRLAREKHEEAAEYTREFVPNTAFFKTHIDFASGFVGGSWHPPELRGGQGYCWSSSAAPWIAFLASWKGASILTARAATWVADDLASIKVSVNGQTLPIDMSIAAGNDGSNFMHLVCVIPADVQDNHGLLKIQFELPRTIRPSAISADTDDRDLGLYANWIRLAPATGFHR